MKFSFSVLALCAGFILVSHLSWAGEYFPSQALGQAIPIGYYKVIRPKIVLTPEQEARKKEEEAKRKEEAAKNPKKKKRKHRRGASRVTPGPMGVENVAPQKPMPPTLVPQYDQRPDTMPED